MSSKLHQLSINIVGWVYLIYLALLPSLATFATMRTYGWWYGDFKIMIAFLVGIGAVGVFVAAIWSYQPLPNSLLRLLFLLLDGPLFVLLSQGRGVNPWAFAIEGYLVDGTAVWLAIFWLALRSSKPTPGQRKASMAIMLALIMGIWGFFWPYLQAELTGWRVAWLMVGAIEGTLIRYVPFKKEAVLRGEQIAPMLIVVFVLLFIAALFGGNVFYELQIGV
ncbi:MAG: hypothetical protein DWQ04_17095 [Chloroflexi bacterium]|nr:MAG: hypothetical protein DWQ04_17095 [Chloroflexota bacterium]